MINLFADCVNFHLLNVANFSPYEGTPRTLSCARRDQRYVDFPFDMNVKLSNLALVPRPKCNPKKMGRHLGAAIMASCDLMTLQAN